MAKLVCFRIAGVVGFLSLAFLLVSLDPFLGAAPIPRDGLHAGAPSTSVNRALKGDRLPAAEADTFNMRFWPDQQGASSVLPAKAAPAQIPVGCDPAFSPIFSGSLGNVYRRCMT
jgi:hypothetical protein